MFKAPPQSCSVGYNQVLKPDVHSVGSVGNRDCTPYRNLSAGRNSKVSPTLQGSYFSQVSQDSRASNKMASETPREFGLEVVFCSYVLDSDTHDQHYQSVHSIQHHKNNYTAGRKDSNRI